MIKKSFIKRVRKLNSVGTLGISLPEELNLVEGEAYQFHVEMEED